MNLLMLNPKGLLSSHVFGGLSGVWDMSMLAIVAGVCAVAAGLWNSGIHRLWLLSLHGFALGAFGLIGVSPLIRGPLSFRPVSLLFVVMALSMGAFALTTTQPMRQGARQRWVFSLAGAASIGFALSFFAIGFHIVKLAAPYSLFLWMSSYFAFCAIFIFRLAFHVRSQRFNRSSRTNISSLMLRPAH